MILLTEPQEEPEPYDIHLATRIGRYIPNWQGDNLQPSEIQAQTALETYKGKNRFPQIVDSTYNCLGLVFAARRTNVATEHVKWILQHDDYQKLSGRVLPQRGDVVLYAQEDNIVTHVGVVHDVKSSSRNSEDWEVWVLSKWGTHGAEYVHLADDIPSLYGTAIEYWRHKRHL
jgi:hypothetical protein